MTSSAQPVTARTHDRYEQIWEEFGASLARVASSYEALPQAREDLLQDIRLAIWMALPRFRGESSMRTFVFRIAHNRGLTHAWRRKRLSKSESLDDVQVRDHRAGPEAAALRNSDRERLLTAIRELPIPMRQVITLALEEIAQAEIAAILGITENNVAVRLTRARALLRERLGDKG